VFFLENDSSSPQKELRDGGRGGWTFAPNAPCWIHHCTGPLSCCESMAVIIAFARVYNFF